MQTLDDFDGCWKEALDCYFPDFMALLWPKIAAQIDWSRRHEFLDQELQKLVGKSETGVRRVDKLVKVWMRDGDERWFLIHIEVQAKFNGQFAMRLLTYYTRLRDRFGRTVESLVVITHDPAPTTDAGLGDTSCRWHYVPRETSPIASPESELHARLPGFHQIQYDARSRSGNGLMFHFPAVYLSGWRRSSQTLERIGHRNPFAVVILAQLEASASRNGARRFTGKVRIMRLMYSYRYTKADISKVLRLIDWMIQLPKALEPAFNDEIRRIEAEDEMTYVTSFERVAQTEMLRRLLTRKFGALPNWAVDKLEQADTEQILQWADRVLEETSLQAVFQA